MSDSAGAHGEPAGDNPFGLTTLIYVSGCPTSKATLETAQRMSDLPLLDLSPFGHGGAGEHCGEILRAMLADPTICMLVRPTRQQLQDSGFLVDIFSSAGMIYLAADTLPTADAAELPPQHQEIFTALESTSIFIQPESINPDSDWDGWHLLQPPAVQGETAEDVHDAFCLTLLAGFSRLFPLRESLELAVAAAELQARNQPASGWRDVMQQHRRRDA